MKYISCHRLLLLGIFVFLLFPLSTDAVARTWGGGAGPMDGNWNTAVNWTGDAVPGSSDDVTFDGTDTTTVIINALSM